MTHPHGSRERYEAGCECDGCRLCMILHTKHDPVPTSNGNGSKRLDAEPFALIIRALLREGLTLRKLANLSGYDAVTLRNIALGVTTWIYPDTARALTSLVRFLPSERVEMKRA